MNRAEFTLESFKIFNLDKVISRFSIGFETHNKHLLFTLAYLGLGIYVQLAYVYGPMDILVDGHGNAVAAFITAGTFLPAIVMAFTQKIKKGNFRNSFSKFMLFTFIALGFLTQLAFGIYVLIHYGFHAWGAAHDSMRAQMLAWDANEIARDTDYFQNYFECCGAIDGPSDWIGMSQTFRDYAKVRVFHFLNLNLFLNSTSMRQQNGQFQTDVC